jgi:hypothetical protein
LSFRAYSLPLLVRLETNDLHITRGRQQDAGEHFDGGRFAGSGGNLKAFLL